MFILTKADRELVVEILIEDELQSLKESSDDELRARLQYGIRGIADIPDNYLLVMLDDRGLDSAGINPIEKELNEDSEENKYLVEWSRSVADLTPHRAAQRAHYDQGPYGFVSRFNVTDSEGNKTEVELHPSPFEESDGATKMH